MVLFSATHVSETSRSTHTECMYSLSVPWCLSSINASSPTSFENGQKMNFDDNENRFRLPSSPDIHVTKFS
jgi:hypothetical protein